MGKSIRSKSIRRFRSLMRVKEADPREAERLQESLSRLQESLVSSSSLMAAKAALARTGDAPTLVENEAAKEERFSFAGHPGRLSKPKFNVTLQDMLRKQLEEEEKAKEEARKLKAGRSSVAAAAAAGDLLGATEDMDDETAEGAGGKMSVATRARRNLRKARKGRA